MTLEQRLNNIKLWFGEYWLLWITGNLCVFLAFYAYGCEPKTKSLTDPAVKITRLELNEELDTLLIKAKIGEADLDRQEEIRNMIFNQTLLIAQGNQVNPIGIVTTLMAIFGIGATADDIRLRKQRKKEPVYDTTDTG